MKRSVSIKFMWADLPWPERVRRAAAAGFDRVEMWDWREPDDIDELAAVARECGIEIAGFFGHHQGGLANPDELDLVLESLRETVEVAERVGADQLHVFSDGMRRPEGHVTKPPPITRDERQVAAVEALRECLKLVDGKPMELCVESINTVHVPGYFLEDSDMSVALCREVDDPQVTMFFDCFHQQLVGGRLTDHLLHALPYVSSVHIANVPGRHHPAVGEINFHHIRRVLDEAGYDRQLTFEVVPIDGDSAGALEGIKEVFPFACAASTD
jgi:hydroxypyruvate isomerase